MTLFSYGKVLHHQENISAVCHTKASSWSCCFIVWGDFVCVPSNGPFIEKQSEYIYSPGQLQSPDK